MLAARELRREPGSPAAEFAAMVVEAALRMSDPDAGWGIVAHRIVHGGTRHRRPCLIDDPVRAAIDAAAPLAPLHNPAALAVVDQFAARAPGLPQVAVFDTAFFADLPAVASGYALPPSVSGPLELVRCGFHGLAHADLWEATRTLPGPDRPRRVISLQLGSGASVAAVLDGRALDVSMGYSTLEGLVMGTRCGDLDAGALLRLLRQPGSDAEQLAELLARRSGLLGLSGRSPHVHELLAAGDAASRHALDLYVYRASRYIGSYLAVLGGVDAIAFGGGVGEHSPEIRARILAPLGFAGVHVDDARNRAATGGLHEIGVAEAPVRILAVPVDESRQLARAAAGLAVLAAPG